MPKLDKEAWQPLQLIRATFWNLVEQMRPQALRDLLEALGSLPPTATNNDKISVIEARLERWRLRETPPSGCRRELLQHAISACIEQQKVPGAPPGSAAAALFFPRELPRQIPVRAPTQEPEGDGPKVHEALRQWKALPDQEKLRQIRAAVRETEAGLQAKSQSVLLLSDAFPEIGDPWRALSPGRSVRRRDIDGMYKRSGFCRVCPEWLEWTVLRTVPLNAGNWGGSWVEGAADIAAKYGTTRPEVEKQTKRLARLLWLTTGKAKPGRKSQSAAG